MCVMETHDESSPHGNVGHRDDDGRFVVNLADVYGKDIRPANAGEAGAVASALRADRPEMRKRGDAALTHFRSLAAAHGGEPRQLAAIGFCFSGGMALEMARSGADATAFVSFHGDLTHPGLRESTIQQPRRHAPRIGIRRQDVV